MSSLGVLAANESGEAARGSAAALARGSMAEAWVHLRGRAPSALWGSYPLKAPTPTQTPIAEARAPAEPAPDGSPRQWERHCVVAVRNPKIAPMLQMPGVRGARGRLESVRPTLPMAEARAPERGQPEVVRASGAAVWPGSRR